MAHSLRRRLIRVFGPDALTFLDNLLTQDLAPLAAGKRRLMYAALLSPQGKVLTDMFVWAGASGSAVLDVDVARADELVRRLNLYKLRARVTIEDVSDQLGVAFDFGDTTYPVDPRFPDGEMGSREVFETETTPDFDDAGYDAMRIALGVPDLARDAAVDEVFALEALLEELHGVDFQKGCFVGQENVSRMKRRATTRKKFCPIVFEGAAPAFGTPVMAGAAELGSVRTGVAGRAMALLRLDRALEAAAPLTAGGRPVRLDPPDWLILPQRDQG